MEEIEMTHPDTVTLCESIADSITKAHCPEHLCERIVQEVEDRAAWDAFRQTHLGRLHASGVKIRFEGKTLHD